jgi:SAM-dependent methyltransferase
LVNCSSVLEYLPDPLAVVHLAAPVLRVDGVFAVSIPERWSLSRWLNAPFTRRVPAPQRYNAQWGDRIGGSELKAAATGAGLRLLYQRRFGSFSRYGIHLPFDSHRPIATLCLYVFERPPR